MQALQIQVLFDPVWTLFTCKIRFQLIEEILHFLTWPD